MRILTIVLLFVSCFLYSQKKAPLILVQYSETVSQDPSMTNNYIGTLFIEGDLNFYKSEYKNTDTNQNGNENDVIIFKEQDSKPITEIISNKNTNELVENSNESRFLKKSFSIYEAYPKFNWITLPGKKKIDNRLCKQAETTFRGRKYTAWYTEEIPINVGPWKFNGLPGLILSVEDSQGIYKWKLTNIQSPYKNERINLQQAFSKRYKYTKISYKDFDQKFIEAIKNKIDLVQARSSKSGIKSKFSFSTNYEKEPNNEWRKQMFFE